MKISLKKNIKDTSKQSSIEDQIQHSRQQPIMMTGSQMTDQRSYNKSPSYSTTNDPKLSYNRQGISSSQMTNVQLQA